MFPRFAFTRKLCGRFIRLFKRKRNTYRWAGGGAIGLPLILAVIVMTGCAGTGAGSAPAGLGSRGLKAGRAAISVDNPDR
jgi:hypothetical protein